MSSQRFAGMSVAAILVLFLFCAFPATAWGLDGDPSIDGSAVQAQHEQDPSTDSGPQLEEDAIPAESEADDVQLLQLEDEAVYSFQADGGQLASECDGVGLSDTDDLSAYWQTESDGDDGYVITNLSDGQALGSEGIDGEVAWEDPDRPSWLTVCEEENRFSFAPRFDVCKRLSLADGVLSLVGADDPLRALFRATVSKPLTEAVREGAEADEGVYILSSGVGSGKVLDIAGASKADSANAQVYSANGSFAQSFALEQVGPGLYAFRSVCSGKYLDAAGGGKANRANVRQYTGNGTLAQLWYLVGQGGSYVIKNASSGLVLDVAAGSSKNGSNVRLYAPNGTKAQNWVLLRDLPVEKSIAAGNPFSDGIYALRSILTGARSVDIAAGGVNNKANARLYAYNDSFAQKFEITYIGNGFYTIQAACSGKYLDAAGGGRTSGTNVHQYQRNGTRAQWWFFEELDGSYIIKNGIAGLALDIAGGTDKNGTNIRLYTPNGTDAQLWNVGAVPLLADGTYAFMSYLNMFNYIGISSESKANKGNVDSSPAKRSGAQEWNLRYIGDSLYEVSNKYSGLLLDVQGGSLANGANIQQYKRNDSDAQHWRLSISDIGGIVFINAASGKALDVKGGNAIPGTNIQQYAPNESKAQSWSFFSSKSPFVTSGHLYQQVGALSIDTFGYCQKDPLWRWMELPLGSNVGAAGCGPVALAMALSIATGSPHSPANVIPNLSKTGIAYGGYNGSELDLLQRAANKVYGNEVKLAIHDNYSYEELVEVLRSGSVVVLHGYGTFRNYDGTTGRYGHYVCAYGISADGKIMVKDPMSHSGSGAKNPGHAEYTWKEWVKFKAGHRNHFLEVAAR